MLINKRTFDRILLLCLSVILLTGCSSGLLSATPTADTAAQPEFVTLTWTRDPATTQTISWRTNMAEPGQVQYVEAGVKSPFPAKARQISAKTEDIATNEGMIRIHTATLSELKPGTQYRYRVGSEKGWSETASFTTAPLQAKPFSFLVFGDSQSIAYDTWRNTLQQAYQSNPSAAFMINVGDLVDVGQDDAQWRGWFQASAGVINHIPVMPVTGNHECYTPERVFSRPLLFTAQFKLPQNGPSGLMGQAYSFDYGDVHFAMLDSQAGEQKQFMPDLLEKQSAWLDKDLEKSSKKWKIVILHRPLYSNSKSDPHNKHLRTALGPILEKHHADIVFSGHDHVYARTHPLYGDKLAAPPAKGTVYIATGRSGTKFYEKVAANSQNAFFYNPIDEPNYLTVQVNGESLTINSFKQSGALIDSINIKKPAEEQPASKEREAK